MEVAVFTFNEFSENSYILYDSSKECIIIDPGCNRREEQLLFSDFIENNGLKPVKLINTHCHIDHILGNRYVSEKYELDLIAHKKEIPVLAAADISSKIYQINYDPSPEIKSFIDEGDPLSFGETSLEILFTPGGRTDLPGGDFDTLIASIKNKIFPLGDDVIVYSGHGPSTSVANEKKINPFLQ